MTRSRLIDFVFILLTTPGIACVGIDDPASADESFVGESETGNPDEPESPRPNVEIDGADSLRPTPAETCGELESLFEMAVTEIRGCTADGECLIHPGADRCGCDVAALPIPVEQIFDPFDDILDAAGCLPSCPAVCVTATEAACIDGLCEIVG